MFLKKEPNVNIILNGDRIMPPCPLRSGKTKGYPILDISTQNCRF
jgi:hypothetical protein